MELVIETKKQLLFLKENLSDDDDLKLVNIYINICDDLMSSGRCYEEVHIIQTMKSIIEELQKS